MTELLVGHIVGKYRVEEKLGEGGMGAVYKATDLTLDRSVALKILLAEITEDLKTRDRLRQEAKALARFNHPNIAILYEFDEVNNFLAMEFIEGETVDAVLAREGPLKPERIRDIMRQVLPALSMAHKAGIIHRDIKPSNIMVTKQGTVKIMDFGIAKISGSGAQTVSTGRIVGSYLYISPEQIEHRSVDARTDVYSLGATLYELATGHVPFETENHFLLMKAHIEEPPPPPSYKHPAVLPALEKLILKALEKKPEERFQSAEEMLLAFETMSLKKGRANAQKEGKKFSIKRVLVAAAAAVLVLGGAGVLGVWFFSGANEPKFKMIPVPGTLILSNLPEGGVLKINGEKKEFSPDGYNLPEGEYKLAVEFAGRPIWEKRVEVAPGKNRRVEVEYSPEDVAPPSPESRRGSFTLIPDQPGVQIFLDGQPIEVEGPVPVDSGRHILRLAASEYRDTTIEFEISPEEKKNFGTVRLPGLAQWIDLKNVPSDARVMLNNDPVDYSGQKLEVVSGTHAVTIQAPKRVGFTQTVKVSPGKPTTVSYVLPKGKLNLKAIPYATFFIDGRPTGRSGLSLDTALEAGSYEVRFTHPGFGKGPLRFDTTVFVGDGSTARVQYIFKPKK